MEWIIRTLEMCAHYGDLVKGMQKLRKQLMTKFLCQFQVLDVVWLEIWVKLGKHVLY